MLATYRAIKNAGISVTIDGHGSDELFSGYGHLKKALACVTTRKEFAEILSIDESCRTGVYTEREKLTVQTLLRHRLKILIGDYLPPNLRRFLGGLLPSRLARGSAKFLFRESPVESDVKSITSHPAFQAMDVFSQVLYEIFHVTILPTLLRNYDRYSMASGVEIRMPFMDWRLVCFTFSLPWQSKLGGTYTKRIQRDALAGILIDPVRLRRDKIGWNAPSHEWFRGPLGNSVDSWLNDSSLAPYHSRALKAWHLFQDIEKPSFRDGEVFWNDLLPFLWTQSLTEEAWS
jgi:asparagine synthase (glutamine-hydrolysing)